MSYATRCGRIVHIDEIAEVGCIYLPGEHRYITYRNYQFWRRVEFDQTSIGAYVVCVLKDGNLMEFQLETEPA